MLKKAWDKILKFLFGDDIFISYARADGGIYATGLANELVKENFSCEFDSWGTESGKDIPDSLTTSLKRCSVLVIIGTESAAQNNNVKLEIEMFAKTGRPIIPIIFEGVELTGGRFCQTGKFISPGAQSETAFEKTRPLTQAIWADLIAGQSISCELNEALEKGDPSDAIVNRISKSYTFARRDQRLKRASLAATALLLLLTTLSVAAGFIASAQFAEVIKQKAIADRKDRQARSSLAQNYANVSKLKEISDPTEAISFIEKAIEIIPEDDANLSLYNQQAFDLLNCNPTFQDIDNPVPIVNECSNKPQLIINLPNSVDDTRNVYNTLFSPQENRVVAISDKNNVTVWDLNTGEEVGNPLRQNTNEFIELPAFSPDGKRIAALIKDKDEKLRLIVWDAIIGTLQLDKLDSDFTRSKISVKKDRNEVFKEIDYGTYSEKTYRDFQFTPNSQAIMVATKRSDADNTYLRVINIPNNTNSTLNELKSFEIHSRGKRFLPISRNPEYNWIITFDDVENESKFSAKVLDLDTGRQIGENIVLDKNVDTLDFTKPEIASNNSPPKIFYILIIGKRNPKTNETEATYSICAYEVKPNKNLGCGQTDNYLEFIGFGRNNNELLVYEKDSYGAMGIWNISEKVYKRTLRDPKEENRFDRTARFSKDGKYLVTSSISLEESSKKSAGRRDGFPLKRRYKKYLVEIEYEGLIEFQQYRADFDFDTDEAINKFVLPSAEAYYRVTKNSIIKYKTEKNEIQNIETKVNISGKPDWIKGMGEARSGIRINENLVKEQIPQGEYVKIRREYFDRLWSNAENGDIYAEQVLRSWNPCELVLEKTNDQTVLEKYDCNEK